MQNGLSFLEEAFRTPVYTGNKITINGKTYKSIREAAKDKGFVCPLE